MTENTTQRHDPRRRDWDAAYREKNREKRRAYDRERMRQLRSQRDES